MSVLSLAGSILAILIYFPLWNQIRTNRVRQNYLAWILWASLDTIAAATIIAQHGSFFLPLTYAVGGAITALFILRTGVRASWTWLETSTLCLVFTSMAIWYFSGSKVATIASTTAMNLAGIPQLIDAWKKPQEMPFGAYAGYFVANCLATAGGKTWSVEERFFPAAGVIFCLVIVLFSARKFWLKSKIKN